MLPHDTNANSCLMQFKAPQPGKRKLGHPSWDDGHMDRVKLASLPAFEVSPESLLDIIRSQRGAPASGEPW